MSAEGVAPHVGDVEWLESLGRTERMAIALTFAKFGDRAHPPVDAAALVHLRYLVAEVKRLEALLVEAGGRP